MTTVLKLMVLRSSGSLVLPDDWDPNQNWLWAWGAGGRGAHDSEVGIFSSSGGGGGGGFQQALNKGQPGDIVTYNIGAASGSRSAANATWMKNAALSYLVYADSGENANLTVGFFFGGGGIGGGGASHGSSNAGGNGDTACGGGGGGSAAGPLSVQSSQGRGLAGGDQSGSGFGGAGGGGAVGDIFTPFESLATSGVNATTFAGSNAGPGYAGTGAGAGSVSALSAGANGTANTGGGGGGGYGPAAGTNTGTNGGNGASWSAIQALPTDTWMTSPFTFAVTASGKYAELSDGTIPGGGGGGGGGAFGGNGGAGGFPGGGGGGASDSWGETALGGEGGAGLLLVFYMGELTPEVEEPVPEPFILTLDSGRDPTLRQRLVNMYTEPTPKGPTKFSRYQRPGLDEVEEVGDGPVRVTFKWGDYRFTVSGNEVYRDTTLIGTVFGANAPVRFAYSDEEVVIVSGGAAWYVTTSSVTAITDPDLPSNIVDVAFLAGRFIYVSSNDTTFYWSDLNDARTIGGLDFATAAENTKDICVAVIVLADQLVFFTRKVTEFWSPSTNPDSPYIRSPGRKTDLGLGARHSVVLMDNALIFVGFDKQVYRTGAVPLKISNFEVDDYLRQATQEELEEDCHAFTVNFGGHEFYVVYIPNNGSWAYDLSMKEWAEWRSWNRGRFRAMCAEDNFMGDFYTGKVMGFNGGRFVDVEGVTEPIERVINFYRPLEDGRVPNTNVVLACTRGTTTLLEGHGSDPVCEMAFSDDEGRTYSGWRAARIGMQGERTDYAKAVWHKLGRISPPGRHFLFRCTDPVRWSPFGVGINVKRP